MKINYSAAYQVHSKNVVCFDKQLKIEAMLANICILYSLAVKFS